jgi:hypothetical protein
MAESTKIVKGSGSEKKTVGYEVPNKSGGKTIVKGGQGKDGYIGRTEKK